MAGDRHPSDGTTEVAAATLGAGNSPAIAVGGRAGLTSPVPARAAVARHEVLAAVFRVRARQLQVLLWRRARPPFAWRWSLPGGPLTDAENLAESVSRQLAQKVDLAELSHLEQVETRADPTRYPGSRVIATSYLGLIPADISPRLPADTTWHDARALPQTAFDHAELIGTAIDRLHAKLSYTNLGFALAPSEFTISELAGYYQAALGRPVDATNLQRILTRREQIEPTGDRRRPGSTGGRPAAAYRFRTRSLQVTDAFAVLHP